VNDTPRTLPASVIIPSRNRQKLLGECVQSILGSAELPRELIIVDQSEAHNRELAELGTVNGCRVIYRHTTSRGVSTARNEACALAGEDVLLFTDDDILVSPEWLGVTTRLVQREADTTLISGRVRFIDANQAEGFAPSLMEEEQPRLFEGRIWNDVLFSNNMAFARAVYDRLGPFDPRLGVGGPYRAATDNDYGYRALEAGYRIRYAPESLVYHQAWRHRKSYWRVQWAYGVGQGAFLTKHVHLRDRYTGIRLRNDMMRHVRWAREKRKRAPEEARDDAVFALGLVYGFARWMVCERLRGR
jgi:glycosyltransferase involved in cell wall biosynthesis